MSEPVIRYKGGFDYRNNCAGVRVRMFSRETDSRLYSMPDEAIYTKWCDKREWPFTSFEEAKQATISHRKAQVARLEFEIAEHLAAIASLEAATRPIQPA